MAFDFDDSMWSSDGIGRRPSVGRSPDGDDALATAFALCFAGTAGRRVLEHLRKTTIERRLGPEASDALLRYLEGQRQLVDYITALVRRGGGRVLMEPAAHDSADTPHQEPANDR